jgi:hypothetical protein
MRKALFGSALVCAMLATVSASADDSRFRYVGMNFDLGAPDGVALGVVVRPHLNWLRLNAAFTENVLAPGVRFGATVDPIKFGIAPTFTVEGGHYWSGSVPVVSNPPTLGYDYANLHLGLEFGNRDKWRIYLHGGLSYMSVHTGNFQNTVSSLPDGVSLGNPWLNGWIAPTGKLGFAIYF